MVDLYGVVERQTCLFCVSKVPCLSVFLSLLLSRALRPPCRDAIFLALMVNEQGYDTSFDFIRVF